MTDLIGLALNAIFIVVVGIGIVQAMRLIRQLQDLRASRTEMERFVRDFNGAVIRAEAGIKSLRSAARESGDDLEKLVDKAVKVRDELNFLVESADGVADRLSARASSVMHTEQAPKPQDESKPFLSYERSPAAKSSAPAKPEMPPSSRAEKELMQALEKLK
jgi:hypothetical protein